MPNGYQLLSFTLYKYAPSRSLLKEQQGITMEALTWSGSILEKSTKTITTTSLL